MRTAWEKHYDATRRMLETDRGSVNIAAMLLRRYLIELCEMTAFGGFGRGFVAEYDPHNCPIDEICCSPCDRIVDAYVPSCLIGMGAAKWNSPGITGAMDPIGDGNFPNAWNHGNWARALVYPRVELFIK